MFSHLSGYKVVLASKSPRRQSLLKDMGLDFEIRESLGEELYPESLEPKKVAEFLAIQKADWFTNFDSNELYITADTVVICNQKVLGKPKTKEEATTMLGQLSGNTHEVITGVALKTKDKEISFSCSTEVTFKDLSTEMIQWYINKFEPFDKAGSYGIQEWIGMVGISKINGSYFNVVGLPTSALFDALEKI